MLLLRSRVRGTTATLASGCISQTGCYIYQFLLHADDENALNPLLIKHVLQLSWQGDCDLRLAEPKSTWIC